MEDSNNWGGKRPGAGRLPPAADGTPRKMRSLKASDAEWDAIKKYSASIKKGGTDMTQEEKTKLINEAVACGKKMSLAIRRQHRSQKKAARIVAVYRQQLGEYLRYNQKKEFFDLLMRISCETEVVAGWAIKIFEIFEDCFEPAYAFTMAFHLAAGDGDEKVKPEFESLTNNVK